MDIVDTCKDFHVLLPFFFFANPLLNSGRVFDSRFVAELYFLLFSILYLEQYLEKGDLSLE